MKPHNFIEHEIKTDKQYAFSLYLTTEKAAKRFESQNRDVPNYLLAIDSKVDLQREIHGVYIRPETNGYIGKFNDLLNVSTEYTEAEKSKKLRILHNLGVIGH